MARGIPLESPPGDSTRPATDRMREALFSSLGPRVDGARVLDLFAGTGAYGLEAWSRGAASVFFVERDRKVRAVLERNAAAVAKSLGAERPWPVRFSGVNVEALAPAPPESMDIVIADPPYSLLPDAAGLLFARAGEWLTQGDEGCFVLEMPGGMELSFPGWICLRRLGKGRHQPSLAVYGRSL